MDRAARIAENLNHIKARAAEAARRAGRDPASVRLVAVTKSVGIDDIVALVAAGQSDLGENRVQMLQQRVPELAARLKIGQTGMSVPPGLGQTGMSVPPGLGQTGMSVPPSNSSGTDIPVCPFPIWHMIGHLQRNKVKAVLPLVDWIHSVDSLRLGEEIGKRAGEAGRVARVLVEVNVSGEESKEGMPIAGAADEIARLFEVPHLSVVGLMTMAPLEGGEAMARGVFAGLRNLRDRLRSAGAPPAFTELSMGMSGDFETAVEEGATIIRVGTALFV